MNQDYKRPRRAIQDLTEWAGLVSGLGAIAPGGGALGAAARGATASAVTQGIGVATGLQNKFSFVGVAAAGVGAGVGAAFGEAFGGVISRTLGKVGGETFGAIGANIASGVAGGIANAATRSALNGSSFQDNFKAAIPDIVGQAIGSAIAGGVGQALERATVDPVVARHEEIHRNRDEDRQFVQDIVNQHERELTLRAIAGEGVDTNADRSNLPLDILQTAEAIAGLQGLIATAAGLLDELDGVRRLVERIGRTRLADTPFAIGEIPLLPGAFPDVEVDFSNLELGLDRPGLSPREARNLDPHFRTTLPAQRVLPDDLEIAIEDTVQAIFSLNLANFSEALPRLNPHFFRNDGSQTTNGARLPDENGQTYVTFDVNLDDGYGAGLYRRPGEIRFSTRIVLGSDGFAYFTRNHYESFERLSIHATGIQFDLRD